MQHNKLSAEQIDQLYTFTRQHFVEHYDLQTELVDHLANAIETRWVKEPNVPFEDALQAAFKKFGIFGFSDVVEQRSKALGKRYQKLMWGYFKTFFTVPRLLLTLALIVCAKLILAYNVYVMLALYISMQVYSLYRMSVNIKAFNKKAKETGRKWMFEEMIFRGVTFSALAGFWFQFGQMMYNTQSVPGQWLIAVLS